jgi:CubicO group peptidase (beta-lactamase class C family)/chromosome segregation ATPase
MNMPGRRPLAQIICLIPMLLLAFCWVDRAAATTSQNSAETSSLDLKWLASSPSLLGFNTVKLETTVGNIGDLKGVYSVIIVRNNYMVVERYFREGTRTKPHNLKSATKSVMAALTGIAIEKGYLRLDQPIGDFLPQAKYLDDPRKADITLLHLLTMTSGLEQTSSQAYNSLAMNSTDWVWTILNRPLVADPGTKHQYSTGDTHILSAVLTGATGMSTRDFAEKYLFGPLGISVKGWEIDPKGINQGGNNLSLIPLDMALFGQLYLDGGIYRNQQIIPKWWVEASTRPNYLGKHELYGYYSYLWYSRPMGANAFVAVGYGGQYIYVSPEYNCVVVITSTLESKGKAWEKELFDYIQEGLLGSIEPEQLLLQVKYDGKDAPTFYESGPVSSSAASGEKRKALAVTTLNLRKGPSKSTAVIKLLDGGTVLEIQEQQGSWFKVLAVNLNGWVSAEYVRLITPERIQLAKRQPEAAGPVRQELAAKAPAPETRLSQQDTVLKQSQNLVEQLQSRIETFQKTQQQLEDDLNRTREKMVTEQQATARLEAERKKLKQELAELRTQVDTQDTNLNTAQGNHNILQSELTVLQKELAEQKEISSRTTADKRELESKLTATNKQIAELQEAQGRSSKQEIETLKKLKQDLAAGKAQLNTVEKQLQVTQSSSANISTELAKLNKELEQQRQAVAESEAARKTLEAELAGMQDQLDSQTGTLITVQAKRDTLQVELSALQQEITEQKETATRTVTDKSQLEKNLAESKAQIVELRTSQNGALAQLEKARKQLEAELDAERTQRKSAEKQLQKTETSQESASAELDMAKKRIEKQKFTVADLKAALEKSSLKIAWLQKDLEAQQKLVTQSESDRKNLETQLAENKTQIEALNSKERQISEEAAQSRQQLEQELATGRKQLQKLEANGKDNAAKLARANEELEIQRQANTKAENTYEKIKMELAETHDRLNSKINTLIVVQSHRDILQEELDTLQKDIAIQQETAQKAAYEKKGLEDELAVKRAQMDELVETQQQLITQATKTRQQLEQKLNAEREQLSGVKLQLQKAETNGKELTAQLGTVNMELEKQKQETAQSEAARKSLEADLANLQNQFKIQTDSLATVQSKRDSLQAELTTLQKDMVAQQETAKQTVSAKTGLEAELISKRSQMEELGETQRQLIAQAAKTQKQQGLALAASQKQAEDLKSALGEALALTTNSDTELAKVQKELQEHQQVALQATTKQKQLEHDLKNEQNKLENIANELQKSHASRQNLEARLADMNQELENQQRTTRQSEIIRESQEAELAELQSQIAEQAATLTKTQTKGTTLQAEMAALQKELSTGQITILRVTSANIDLEKNNKSLEEKLAATLNQKAVLEAALKTTPAPAKEPEVLVAKVEESALKPSKPEPHKVSVPAGPTFRLTGKTAATREKTPASEPEAKIQKPVIAATEKPDFDGVDVFIKSWAKAWEQKHVDSYLAHYSKKFQPSGKISLAAWKKQRRQRLSNPKLIKIDISEVKNKTTSASRVRVDFTQKYQSNTYSDQVVKTFDLQWENGGWAIVKETSRAI